MNEPFLDFEWPVAPAYEWADLLGENGKPRVVPCKGLASLESRTAVEWALKRFELKGRGTGPLLHPVGGSGTGRTYTPMRREHAALFRLFAALDYRDREAIRAFANQYGLLGEPSKHGWGESHLAWAREICLMQEALELSQPTTPATEQRERAIWSQHDAAIRTLRRRQGVEPEDPVEHRRQARRNKLAWLFNVHLQHVQGRMIFDPNVPPRMKFAPLTLLAAMWLQLALAIAGDKQFVACKFCRHLFEISTEQTGFRSHREFCTDVCKTKDYRRRKRTALKLAAGGASLSTIAERTDTKRATVHQWLAASKKRRTGAQKGEQ